LRASEPNRAFPSLFFFSRFHRPQTSHTICHGYPVLPALVLLLCILFPSVRGISECFRALYVLTQRLHLSITPSLLHTLAAICFPSGLSTWALRLVTLQVTANRCKKSLQDKGETRPQCQSSVTSSIIFSHSTFPGSRKPSPALAWHKDELARQTSQIPLFYNFTNTRLHPITLLPSIPIDSSHTMRWGPIPIPCQAAILALACSLSSFFHLDLQIVRHRLDNDLAVSTYKPSPRTRPAFWSLSH